MSNIIHSFIWKLRVFIIDALIFIHFDHKKGR